MTWTYTLPPVAALDQVRLLIGDTDTTDQQLQDEEIAYFLSVAGSTADAARRAIRALIAKYSRQLNRTVGDLSLSGTRDRIAAYQALLEEIDKQAQLLAVPTAGGISIAEKEALEADADRPLAYTRLGQQVNPEGNTTPTTRRQDQELEP